MKPNMILFRRRLLSKATISRPEVSKLWTLKYVLGISYWVLVLSRYWVFPQYLTQTNQANLVVRQGLEWCRTVHFSVSRFLSSYSLTLFRLNYHFQAEIKNIDKKSRWLRKLKTLYLGRTEFFLFIAYRIYSIDYRYRSTKCIIYHTYHLKIRIN